jgi:hypothetical protein
MYFSNSKLLQMGYQMGDILFKLERFKQLFPSGCFVIKQKGETLWLKRDEPVDGEYYFSKYLGGAKLF